MSDDMKQTPSEEITTPQLDESPSPQTEDTIVEQVAVQEPEQEAAPAAQPQTADEFVKSELAAARASLRNVQVFGSIIVIALGIYFISIAATFINYMQPAQAASVISGIATQQIEDHREEFINEVSTRVPAMIQEAPDYVMENIPKFRQDIEDKFVDGLSGRISSSSDNLAANLDQYIIDNKEEIQAIIAASQDPAAMAELGPTIREEVLAYLKEKPEQGESIDAQIQESLRMITSAEQRLNRLATGQNLTADEKKARLAIAIIANTIDAEQLEPVSLPQLSPEAIE